MNKIAKIHRYFRLVLIDLRCYSGRQLRHLLYSVPFRGHRICIHTAESSVDIPTLRKRQCRFATVMIRSGLASTTDDSLRMSVRESTQKCYQTHHHGRIRDHTIFVLNNSRPNAVRLELATLDEDIQKFPASGRTRPPLLRSKVVMLRFDHRQRLYGSSYLVEHRPHTCRWRNSVDEAHPRKHGRFDARGKVHCIEVKCSFHYGGISRKPVGIACFAAMQITVRIGTCRHTSQDRCYLFGAQAGEYQALLTTHAATHQHDRFSIPVRPRHQIVEST